MNAQDDGPAESSGELEEIVGVGGEDPNSMLPNQPIDILGVSKKIVETPRSVSSVSGETIEKFNILELADVSRFSPSTYTAFSFGVQGGLNIRGDSAETYYAGMKKLNNQSNVKTIIGASDGVTIVRGPPSAALGAGVVGGFWNYEPKSARATTGKYLDHLTGKIGYTTDNWGKELVSFAIGGPSSLFGKRAGFYIYSEFERSTTFYVGQSVKDDLVQATYTMDLTDDIHFEVGGSYQLNVGTGIAGWNRVTQDLIDNGTYQTGEPDFSLIDTNGDGVASRAELYNAGLTNNYRFDANGNPLKNQVKPGTTAYTDPNGPLAFVTNVGTATLSRRVALLERVNHGVDYLAYTKLVNDANPNLIFKNNTFFEHQDYYKLSDIAYFRAGNTSVFEERASVEWHPQFLPDWLTVTNTTAFNIRYLDATNSTTNSYQIFNYWDLTKYTDGYYLFQNGWDDPDEAGVDSKTRSQHKEIGFGNLLDITAFDKLNVTLATRWDYVGGEVIGYPGLKNSGTNTLATTAATYAKGHGDAVSLTQISVSYKVTPNIVPYVTYAKPKTLVPGSTGGLSGSQIAQGILQGSQLKEAGVKGEFFHSKLFISYAAYEQFRTAFNQSLNGGDGGFQQTRGRGQEVEVRWVPSHNFNLAVAGDWSRRDNLPLTAGYNSVGLVDLPLDPIQFGGGRYQLAYDTSKTRQARPDKVISAFANYIFGNSGFDVSLGCNYTAGYNAVTNSDIFLPSALTFSADIGYKYKSWVFRISGKNLTDEWFFTSTSGSAGLIPQPGRTFTGKVSYQF